MIFTSYFGNMKNIRQKNPDIVFISIAGNTPDWVINQENCFQMREFAPKYNWWKEWHEKFKDRYESEESKRWYEKRYFDTILSSLNLNDVMKSLKAFSNGKDVCFLCYETPEKFCHRHLMSKWLTDAGVNCEEMSNKRS